MPENIKIYFYIIVGAIYLIYQVIQQKKKASDEATAGPQQEQPKPVYPTAVNKPTTPPVDRPKALTLEEMLSELNHRTIKVVEKNPRTAKPSYVDYEENIQDEELLAQEKLQQDIQAAAAMRQQRISLSDEHLKPYALQQKRKNIYAAMLNDPDSLRKAFVMAEILKRKF